MAQAPPALPAPGQGCVGHSCTDDLISLLHSKERCVAGGQGCTLEHQPPPPLLGFCAVLKHQTLPEDQMPSLLLAPLWICHECHQLPLQCLRLLGYGAGAQPSTWEVEQIPTEGPREGDTGSAPSSSSRGSQPGRAVPAWGICAQSLQCGATGRGAALAVLNVPEEPKLPSHTETALQKFSLVLQHISSPEGILQGQTWQNQHQLCRDDLDLGCLDTPLDVREALCLSLALFPDDVSDSRS